MKVLVLGSGGRENAFCWKIKQSSLCMELYAAPGNAGTAQIATNVSLDINDFEAVKHFVLERGINFVLVGPEEPLVLGIVDFFKSDAKLKDVKILGPSKLGARLEGSKEFCKQFMARHNIPTAAYKSFTAENLIEADAFIDSLVAPYVLKADGLAAGKGVLIIEDKAEAKSELRSMILGKKFGLASEKVVVEEFLSGIELSVFAVTDGKNYKMLPEAKDYKRVGEGDTGLNTGGMGAVSPVPFAGSEFMKKVEERIVRPTIEGFAKDKIDYTGFVFFGLIKVGDEPMVIEYNVRMGDPETEVVIPRIKSDFFELLIKACSGGDMFAAAKLESDSRACATVMVTAGGYPEVYKKGDVISGIDGVDTSSIVFHAGTVLNDKGEAVTNGGRVLALSSYGDDFMQALSKSYSELKKIDFKAAYYRRDLGRDLVADYKF